LTKFHEHNALLFQSLIASYELHLQKKRLLKNNKNNNSEKNSDFYNIKLSNTKKISALLK